MKFSQVYNGGYPMMTANPQVGELSYDQHLGELMVYDGVSWASLHSEFSKNFSEYDFEKIQRFINNIDKYEEILKQHFPEDFL